MIAVLKIICYFSSLISLIGLIILNSYFWQEKKNRLQLCILFNQYSIDLNKKLENYKIFVSKDITNWANQARTYKSEFKIFQEQYIHHQSQVHEKLKKLEKND